MFNSGAGAESCLSGQGLARVQEWSEDDAWRQDLPGDDTDGAGEVETDTDERTGFCKLTRIDKNHEENHFVNRSAYAEPRHICPS